MKTLASIQKEIGADGAALTGLVGVEQSNLVVRAEIQMPLNKVIEPATKAVDGLLDKLKAAIPGTWDDVMIDKFKEEYKADLVKLLAEPVAQEVTPA